ncbi:hypothetical protein HDV63DRAFT_278127 [Trichoderma sp. SZMC 28014]
MPIQVSPMTCSTIRIQRLYYPPISDTRPHAYQACEYWRTQDEVTKRALLTPFTFFIIIYLFVWPMHEQHFHVSWRHLNPLLSASSREKGKPADLIPFASPSSLDLSLFCFFFFTLFFRFPPLIPQKLLAQVLRFSFCR